MRPEEYAEIVERALAEDLGGRGDITSAAVIDVDAAARGEVIARGSGVIAGLEVAAAAFTVVDPEVSVEAHLSDGDRVGPGDLVATVAGRARPILAAERTALNLLGRMSGVATATARLVEAVEGTGATILDTRKTMPGLRMLDKYAVRMGGGSNHRMGLYDAVLIKDNHIAAVGDLRLAVSMAREMWGPETMVEVEVEDLDQLAAALDTDADRVLLDNMDTATLRRAVEMVDGRMETEASGGVTPETVREIAETGVNFISVGWITHSPAQLDLALEFVS